MARALKPGDVVLLENCRFNKGEKKDDEALARKIAALCDVYVNDAFGTAHRAEATTHGIARFATVACAGPLLAAELDALGKALAQPEAPAGRDRRRLQGLDQAHDPEGARREGRRADRRRRHRQHVHPRRRPADRQVAGRGRPRRRGEGDPRRVPGQGADSRSTRSARRNSRPTRRPTLKAIDERRADDDMILDIGPQTARRSTTIIAQRRHDRLERPGRRVRVRRVRRRHARARRGDRRVDGVLDRRRRRHARRDRQVRRHRPHRLHLHRRRRVPRVPRGQDAAARSARSSKQRARSRKSP